MNNWYAVERLGAAHRADLQSEADRASLAASAQRAEDKVGDRTVFRLRRVARGTVITLVLAAVWAAPAAAAQPTREVFDLHGVTNVYGADQSGCGFAVTVMHPANGKTYLYRAAWRDVERLDPATGIITGVTSGRQGRFTYICARLA